MILPKVVNVIDFRVLEYIDMRHSKELKNRLLEDVRSGHSLGYLMKKFNIPKTTAYYYLRKIRGRKLKDLEISSDQELRGEFCGIFAGDGGFVYNSGYRISFYTYCKEPEYVNHIIFLIGKLFGNYRPYTYTERSVTIVRTNRKLMYDLLRKYLFWTGVKTYSIGLKNPVDSYDKKFLRGFIRGAVDTDGSVDDYGRIAFTSCSKKFFQDVRDALVVLGFNPTVWIRNRSKYTKNRKDNFSAVVKRKGLDKYLREIRFENPYKELKARKLVPMV
ncbi:MAG: hypothetical protein GOV02_01585 [Candidatus Aenigmarchaeota archaeon]|nr:hypothetical protein [Candidatus Aenigmarchaeota archaeon]